MIITGVAILTAVATATVVEAQSAQVVDTDFEPDKAHLQQESAGLAVVRPTHFAQTEGKIFHYHADDSLARTVGRNASFRSMMAEANDCNFTRVILPSDAPSGGFDFLVTTSGQVRQDLRGAIKTELGYTAHHETRDTDVLILNVCNPSLPGLALSSSDESEDMRLADGKLYFKHMQISSILDGLSMGLDKPVLDETDLTNYYDFSVVWNDAIGKKMQEGKFNPDRTRHVLAGWGLGLEATNMPLDMCVVTHAP